MLTAWADMIGFLHEPLFVTKTTKEADLTQGVSQGKGRVLAVERTPSWIAKNRYKLTGMLQIPADNGWNQIAHAIFEATKTETTPGIDVYKR
jgi:hypothetical protein